MAGEPTVSFKLTENDVRVLKLSISLMRTIAGQRGDMPQLAKKLDELQTRFMVSA